MTNTRELNERELDNVNGGYGYGSESPFGEAWRKIDIDKWPKPPVIRPDNITMPESWKNEPLKVLDVEKFKKTGKW